MQNISLLNEKNAPVWQYWRGLGGWNYYFIVKFLLLWHEKLNFHPLENLAFAAFLLLPLPYVWLRIIRHMMAIPIGIALFYYDTWLPGIATIMSEGNAVLHFNAHYLMELVMRFINWGLLSVAFILFVIYLFIEQWIRVTLLIVATLIWMNIHPIVTPFFMGWMQEYQLVVPLNSDTGLDNTIAVDKANATINIQNKRSLTGKDLQNTLDNALARFYENEEKRAIELPDQLLSDAQPFDIIVVHICSLAWSDLDAIGMKNHPLLARFDVLFTQFNSATSYSGPAAIRVLKAGCGQVSNQDLYEEKDNRCYLFENLARLGFKKQFFLDSTGRFDNYLSDVQQTGKLAVPVNSQMQLRKYLHAFDNDPIYDHSDLYRSWFTLNQAEPVSQRILSFINLIALHDGNRDFNNKSADYAQIVTYTFDHLSTFMDDLEKSGRKVLLIVVPEHGHALQGDKIQIAGLRDIPSVDITHVPVGIKFIGMAAPISTQINIDTPTSYLAIAELIKRLIDGAIFTDPQVDISSLLHDLPETNFVSDSNANIVMKYEDKVYFRLKGGKWQQYPQ